jgi:Fic family protein
MAIVIVSFKEGLKGFSGGLSVKNYLAITGTSRATATRDLQALLDSGVLLRTGETTSTRYWLNLPELELFKRMSEQA